MTTTTLEKPAKVAMNGVDVPTLLGTIGAVAGQPELAKFQFRATSEWVDGTHSQARINAFFGAGGEQARPADFVVDADHPTLLCGGDNGAAPVEFLLSALSACITAGIGNIASARQVKLTSVKGQVEADADVQGILGLDENVRNGFSAIRANFKIEGDAPAETLEKIVQQAMARSAVLDILANGTQVDIAIEA